MKDIEFWLSEYSKSHQNKTNKIKANKIKQKWLKIKTNQSINQSKKSKQNK